MEVIEVPAMIVALLLMLAAVAAKVASAQLIARMKNQINHVAHLKAEALGQLKMAQSQKAVAEQNKNMLITKKTKLNKRLIGLKKEMEEFTEADEARKQRAAMRKVD
jgi:hypothetical protein